MMVLLFKINDDRYGIDVANVVEVMPNVPLQKIPRAPEYFSGLLNYRGKILPVIDLSLLVGDKPVGPFLSSRIILVRSCSSSDCDRYVGLLAEHVTEAQKFTDDMFNSTGIDGGGSAFIDKVALDKGEMIQHIDIEKLLPDEMKSMLTEHAQRFEGVGDGI